MQNLLLKLAVLSGVVGGSGFAAWRAYDGLQQVAEQPSAQAFTPLDSRLASGATASEPVSPDPFAGQLSALPTMDLFDSATSAAAPHTDPLAGQSRAFPKHAGLPASETVPASSGARDFPLLLGATNTPTQPTPVPERIPVELNAADPFSSSPIAAPAPAQAESGEPIEPLPVVAQSEPLLFPQPEPVPDQPVLAPVPAQAEPFEPILPQAASEPEPTPASPFGPSHRPAPELLTPAQSEFSPGLTRLPSTDPGPALLPAEDPVPTLAAPRDNASVITADGIESSVPVIRPAGGGAPAPFLPLAPAAPINGQEDILPRIQPGPSMPQRTEAPALLEPTPIPQAANLQERATPFIPLAPANSVAPAPMAGQSVPVSAPAQEELLPTPVLQPEPEFSPAPWTLAPSSPATPPTAPTPAPADPFAGQPVPQSIPVPEPAPIPVPMTPEPAPRLSLPEPSPIVPDSGRLLPDLPTPAPAMSSVSPAVLPLPSLSVEPQGIQPTSSVQPPPQYGTATPAELVGKGEISAAVPSGPQTPELKIEKIAPSEATIGEPVVYAIVIRNAGGSTAQDVRVEDQIPKGAKLEGTIPQAILTNGKLLWELGALDPGAERKIQLKVIPLEPGHIGSVATVSFGASVSASIRVTSPKLTIAMAGPSEAVVGDKLNYSFTLKNSGEGVAKTVFLRAILPAGLKHPGGSDIEYEVGTLTPGQEKTVELRVLAEQPGIITPRGIVSNDNRSFGETSADVRIIESRLRVDRTGPARRFVNRPAAFLTVVTNDSQQLLRNVQVRENLPASIELAGIPVGGRWDPVHRTITWTLPQLKPGESQELKSELVASTAGEHQGIVVAEDGTGNRAEVKTVLDVKGFADLAVDVSSPQKTAVVGEQVSVRVLLKNDGTAPAHNVRASFELPPGLQFAAANGPVSYELVGNTVRFAPLEELAVRAQQSFDLVMTASGAGSTKVTLQLESADFDTLRRDHAIRILAE